MRPESRLPAQRSRKRPGPLPDPAILIWHEVRKSLPFSCLWRAAARHILYEAVLPAELSAGSPAVLPPVVPVELPLDVAPAFFRNGSSSHCRAEFRCCRWACI